MNDKYLVMNDKQAAKLQQLQDKNEKELQVREEKGLITREYTATEFQRIKEKVMQQVVNGLPRGFEIRIIMKSQYRMRGVADTKIGFLVFETTKYGVPGFVVLEIVPHDTETPAIDDGLVRRLEKGNHY